MVEIRRTGVGAVVRDSAGNIKQAISGNIDTTEEEQKKANVPGGSSESIRTSAGLSIIHQDANGNIKELRKVADVVYVDVGGNDGKPKE